MPDRADKTKRVSVLLKKSVDLKVSLAEPSISGL